MCRTERTPPRLLLLLLLRPTETDRSNEPQGEPANLLHYIKARDPVPRKSPPPIPPPLQLIARGPNETSLSRGSLPRVHRVHFLNSLPRIFLSPRKKRRKKKLCANRYISIALNLSRIFFFLLSRFYSRSNRVVHGIEKK